jgi:hypothetical protein
MQSNGYQSSLFADRAHAERAVTQLQALGYGPDRVSLILSGDDAPAASAADTAAHDSESSGSDGTTVGGIAGGVLGAIVAVAGSAIAIAATGGAAAPFVAGPLVAALSGMGVGAVGGAIVGGLIELGEHCDDWQDYVSKGSVVVAVELKSPDDRAEVQKALSSAGGNI